MKCPFCGGTMQLVETKVLPNMEELKLVNGKPTKMTVTLKTMTWRCDCLGRAEN